jgi:hypothetical protein
MQPPLPQLRQLLSPQLGQLLPPPQLRKLLPPQLGQLLPLPQLRQLLPPPQLRQLLPPPAPPNLGLLLPPLREPIVGLGHWLTEGKEEDDFGDTEKNFAANDFGGFSFPTLTSLIGKEDYASTAGITG